MDLRVGGKFKLIKKCGSGAFGEIYQGKSFLLISPGQNVKTGEDVAIKLVSPFSLIRAGTREDQVPLVVV
jgi:hypothetical protein